MALAEGIQMIGCRNVKQSRVRLFLFPNPCQTARLAAFTLLENEVTFMLHGDTSSSAAATAPNLSSEDVGDPLNDGQAQQGVRLFPLLVHEPIPLFPATQDESAIERTKAALVDITTAMVGPSDGVEGEDLSPTPAGFTYFGQFVFHDIVFSQIFGLPRPTGKIQHLKNASSQGLDLSGLYGRGPAVDAHLYDVSAGADPTACRFPIGLPCMRGSSEPIDRKTVKGRDLPRIDLSGRFISKDGRPPEYQPLPFRPLVADPRNDDNLVLSQLLCTLMVIHNRIVGLIDPEGAKPADAYRRARAYLTSVYRTVVIDDYLQRMLHPGVWEHFFGRPDFLGDGVSALEPFNALPLEFTFGASRFAHAMVRQSYVVNEHSVEERATLPKMLSFSSLRPGGQIPIPENWTVDWKHFALTEGLEKPQGARRIGPFLSKELTVAGLSAELDGTIRPVAFMDCWRCYDLKLPSGQKVAEAVGAALAESGIEVPVLTKKNNKMLPTEACSRRYVYNAGRLREALLRHPEFLDATPLSYYIIQEASVLGDDGAFLGPVGSYVVAATVASALFRSPDFNPGAGRLIPDVEPKTLEGLLQLGDTDLVTDEDFRVLITDFASF